MIQELTETINKFLEGVTSSNFSNKYDELAAIIISYNEEGLSKQLMKKSLNEYYNSNCDSLSTHQDEVLVEIISCVEGFCSPHKRIELVDW